VTAAAVLILADEITGYFRFNYGSMVTSASIVEESEAERCFSVGRRVDPMTISILPDRRK